MCKRLQKVCFVRVSQNPQVNGVLKEDHGQYLRPTTKKETHLRISYVPQQNLLYQMSAKSHISNYVSSDQNPCDLWHEPWNPGVLIGICTMGLWSPYRTG